MVPPPIKSTVNPRKNKKFQKYIPSKINSDYNITTTQLLPNLLLSYTHFLNGYAKHISVGYDADTFQPSINITHNPISTIKLTSLDWMHLHVNSSEIKKCCLQKSSAYFKWDTISISVIHSTHNDESIVIFQHLSNISNCITLNGNDWMQIADILDLYKSIYNWLTLYASNISYYYEQYIKHCAAKNIKTLQTSDYFTIDDASKITFNQLRLFYEIPIMCKEKLELDVKLYKLYHK